MQPICAYCSRPVYPGIMKLRSCRRCFVLYHPDCWLTTRRCAIYGCGWEPRRFENVAIRHPADIRWGLILPIVAVVTLLIYFWLYGPPARPSYPELNPRGTGYDIWVL